MNNNTYIHKYIKSLITKDDICVDMTIGNGNDTLLLCELAKYVYGFDINPQALINTNKRLTNFDNYELHLDNHINIDKYIKNKVKLVIFNLGYLPNSQDKTITKASETLTAFKKAYDLLDNNGYIIISFYIGHIGGKDEFYLLDKYIKEKRLLILETYRQEKISSPVTYIIKKLI